MKRFFCSVCKRVRRVRKLPTIIHDFGKPPLELVGECDKHHTPRVPRVRVIRGTFTEANVQQAEGRFNRTNSKVKKVR